jgi:Tol biopolymer transport system component
VKTHVALVLIAATAAASCGADRSQPSGGRFLIYTRHLNSSKQALWIARVDGTHPRLLVRQAIFGALSPDGRWVAFDRCLASRERCETGNAPFALYLIATSGGKPRLLARSTSYPSWSPRSNRLVALRNDTLVSLDLAGNLRVLEPDPAVAGWSFSPDGNWLVYAKARQHPTCASDLFIVRANGGKERRLTHGRDIFPVWGRDWIAFSRYPKSCAYARRIWRIRTDGSELQPVTGTPPGGSYLQGVYYGFDPIEWTPDERTLLAGLATEWGAEAIRVDVATGAFRKLSGYALDLSRDGRVALVDSGGGEGPTTIAAVTLADRRRHRLAHGDVAFPSWNR